jgi:hypothetical protein
MGGLAVQLRARGAEMPVCASPDFAELQVRVGAAGSGRPAGAPAGDRRHAGRSAAMTEHAVLIAGGGRRNGASAAMTRASTP